MYWVCKMCGRSLKSERKPNFCYFDRIDHIENISDEDAEKMGLFTSFSSKEAFEFPGDLHYDPFTGESVKPGHFHIAQFTLSNFQDQIMKKVQL